MDSNGFRDSYDELREEWDDWVRDHPHATLKQFSQKHYDIFDLPLHQSRIQTDGGDPPVQPPPPPPA